MIDVLNLSKVYKTNIAKKNSLLRPDWKYFKAVDEVSFSCKPGRIFSLLGPNGAGKTTTLRIIGTILKPDRGDVLVNNHSVLSQELEVRKSIGFITASTGLYDRLTVDELIAYFADLHKISKPHFQKAKMVLYDKLQMSSFIGKKIGELSTGMKQKVSVCRALIHDPDVVIFDEPTAGLDVITIQSIIEIIKDCREQNKTVLFSTHNMSEVELLCDDLAIIHKGKLIYNNSFENMKKDMKTSNLTEEFIRIITNSTQS